MKSRSKQHFPTVLRSAIGVIIDTRGSRGHGYTFGVPQVCTHAGTGTPYWLMIALRRDTLGTYFLLYLGTLVEKKEKEKAF